MLFEGKTPKEEPSKISSIISAGAVGMLVGILFAAQGAKGGLIPTLIILGSTYATYYVVWEWKRNSK